MQKILLLVRAVPFLGDVVSCDNEDHEETVKEIFVALAFSFLPLLISVIAIYSGTGATGEGLFAIVGESIAHGEVLIICNALVVPIIAISVVDKKKLPPLPYKVILMVFSAGLYVMTLTFFVIERIKFQTRPGAIENTSIIVFLLSVIVIYCATILNSARLDPLARIKSDQDDFTRNLEKHRG